MNEINFLISETLNKYSKQYYTYLDDNKILHCNNNHTHEDNFHTLLAELTGILMMHNIDYEIQDNYNISINYN